MKVKEKLYATITVKLRKVSVRIGAHNSGGISTISPFHSWKNGIRWQGFTKIKSKLMLPLKTIKSLPHVRINP